MGSNHTDVLIESVETTIKALESSYKSTQTELVEARKENARLALENKQLSEMLQFASKNSDSIYIRTDENDEIKTVIGATLLPSSQRDWEGDSLANIIKTAFISEPHNGLFYLDETPYFIDSSKTFDGANSIIQHAANELALRDCLSASDRLKSMGDMAGSLAHQIRTPLSSALLYFSFLLENPESHQVETFAKKGMDNLEHLQGLVEDVLRYARGGKHNNTVISAKNILKISLQSVEKRAFEKKTNIIVEEDSISDTYLIGDENGISTAIQNLIVNAIEASEEGQSILVTTEHEKADWVTFSVRDYGKGIEKKQMSKVFEPFKTDKPNGFGLGLSMVKVIADAHGGEIKANSTVGKGTTFSLLLPVFKEKD